MGRGDGGGCEWRRISDLLHSSLAAGLTPFRRSAAQSKILVWEQKRGSFSPFSLLAARRARLPADSVLVRPQRATRSNDQSGCANVLVWREGQGRGRGPLDDDDKEAETILSCTAHNIILMPRIHVGPATFPHSSVCSNRRRAEPISFCFSTRHTRKTQTSENIASTLFDMYVHPSRTGFSLVRKELCKYFRSA